MPTPPAARRPHGRRSVGGQGGAIAAEQIGIMILIGAVVAGLWAAGIAGSVGDWGRYAACTLFAGGDGDCDRPSGHSGQPALAHDDHAPPVCQLESSERHHRTTTDLLFRRNVEGDRFVITELSDGTMIIIDTEYEGSGHVIGGGGEIPLGKNSKLSLSASGSAIEVEEGGLVYHLDPSAYEAYQEEITQQAIDAYVHGPPELAILEAQLGADSLSDAARAGAYGEIILEALEERITSHATHDLYRTTGEVSLNVGGSWKIVSGSLTVEGSVGSTMQVDRRTGATELTIDLDQSTAATLGVGLLGAGASGGTAQTVGSSITLSFDPDGNLTSAKTNVSYELTGDGAIGFDLAGFPGAPSSQGADWGAGFGWHGSAGALVDLTFEVPIDSEDDRNRLQDVLRNPAEGAFDAFASALGDGSVLMQVHDVTENSDDVSAAIRVLASLGISDERSTSQLQLAHAVSYDPANGLLLRGDCRE